MSTHFRNGEHAAAHVFIGKEPIWQAVSYGCNDQGEITWYVTRTRRDGTVETAATYPASIHVPGSFGAAQMSAIQLARRLNEELRY
jgi:hypothetical protein